MASYLRKHLSSLRIVKEWNTLLQYVVDATTVSMFKGRLDKHVMFSGNDMDIAGHQRLVHQQFNFSNTLECTGGSRI